MTGRGPASPPAGPTAAPARAPLPPGTVLRPDPSLRVRDQGRLLVGGSPRRMIRLSAAGAGLVRRWLAGEPVTAGPDPAPPAVTAAARRLIDAGMVHPVPATPAGTDPQTGSRPGAGTGADTPVEAAPTPTPTPTVVIPVRDDAAGMAATTAGLDGLVVVVVDDGSLPPLPRPDPSDPNAGIRIVQRPRSGGPGPARQTGLGLVSADLVVFVDAGVRIDRAAVARLAAWFADPEVVAVAPRVVSTAPPERGPDGWARVIARFERGHSPLDMGDQPSLVGPGRMVAYVPTACLMARTSAVRDVGGFDPDLRYGEDVDLVWRLGELGSVRYDPSIVVEHPPRTSLRQLARQRFGYGTAAAPLAGRHPGRLAPVRLPADTAVTLVLMASGRLIPVAAVVMAARGWWVRRRLAGVAADPGTEAARLVVGGTLRAARSVADAAVRAWWPITATALLARPTRPMAVGLVAASWGRRLLTGAATAGSGRRRGDPRTLVVAAVDDLAYGAGVWAGAARYRSLHAVRPDLAITYRDRSGR
ncbi:MAG: mycofactocin biosynthesis glycosyltransferase MftF [Acidimicrobiales bacterium]